MTITHSFIRDFTDREAITGYYIISDIRTTLSRAGKPYLSATLTDASGHIRMICWEPDDFVSPDLNGSIVGLCGIVGIYRGELQLTVEHLEEADLSELDTEDINAVIPSAPIHVEAYSQYIYDLVQSISHPQIRAICNELLSRNWDLFSSIPAGKSVHHAFRHGLLMHTADMASLAEPLAAGNPAAINRDLLLGGVLLHDIGKSKIPDRILYKPGPLNDEEWRIMGEHPQIGYDMLYNNVKITTNVRLGILLHHENVDGTGYPRKLKGQKIPEFARIIHIADVYDAMIQKRSYKEAYDPGEFIV